MQARSRQTHKPLSYPILPEEKPLADVEGLKIFGGPMILKEGTAAKGFR